MFHIVCLTVQGQNPGDVIASTFGDAVDFKTFFIFKGKTTLRALVWFELWFIFFFL